MDKAEDANTGASPASGSVTPLNERLNLSESLELSGSVGSKNLAIGMDEPSRLRELQAHVRNQDDLERDIGRQVRRALPKFCGNIGANRGHRPTRCSQSRPMSVIRRGWNGLRMKRSMVFSELFEYP
jgi:hypothetical protein